MKAKFSLFAFLGVVILFSSCKTNTDLNSSALIQKRRYTKGFHVNLKKSHPKKAELIQREHMAMDPASTLEGNLTASIEILDKSLSTETELLFKNDATETAGESAQVAEILKSEKAITDESFYDTSGELVAPFESVPVPAANTDMNFVLILILTILIPPLGIGLVFGISTEFWISLVLTLLFYFPGLIYSLIILLQVY